MPLWFADLLAKSPVLAVAGIVSFYGYKAVSKLIDSPLSIATIVSVLAPKRMRDDAHRTVQTLCDQDDRQPAIEGPPSSPRRTGRRPRRKRRG